MQNELKKMKKVETILKGINKKIIINFKKIKRASKYICTQLATHKKFQEKVKKVEKRDKKAKLSFKWGVKKTWKNFFRRSKV